MDKQTKKTYLRELRFIQREKIWKSEGYSSLYAYCVRKMGFSRADARDLLVTAGYILTSQNMKHSDPKVQQRIDDLRAWRKTTAAASGVSAYVVMPNRTLLAIAKQNPRSKADLEEIEGMGETRLMNYSRAILKCIGTR